MYVLNGTFHEVYTLICGIDMGRSPNSPFAREWLDFNNWLHKRKRFPANQDCYSILREYSDDDKVVLQLLKELFERFSREDDAHHFNNTDPLAEASQTPPLKQPT